MLNIGLQFYAPVQQVSIYWYLDGELKETTPSLFRVGLLTVSTPVIDDTTVTISVSGSSYANNSSLTDDDAFDYGMEIDSATAEILGDYENIAVYAVSKQGGGDSMSRTSAVGTWILNEDLVSTLDSDTYFYVTRLRRKTARPSRK